MDRILAKDGVWLVAVAERPKGWEKFGLAEPEPTASPLLDQVVEQAIVAPVEERPLSRIQQLRKGFRRILRAIVKSGDAFGAEPPIVLAGRVLALGMWTRNPDEIADVVGIRLATAHRLAARAMATGLWCEDGGVILGEIDTDRGDLDFWLNAMGVAGELDVELREGEEPIYRFASGGLNGETTNTP